MGRNSYTLEQLCDLESIRSLKYAYLRCLDQKRWTDMAHLFVEDATASFSGGRYSYSGRDEIVAFLERNTGAEHFHSSHRAHHPEIRLDGDRAGATWALEDLVVDVETGFVLVGAAFYEDVYRSVDGEWLIEHTGYRRSFECTLPTSSIAGFSLTASWWGTDGQSVLPVS